MRQQTRGHERERVLHQALVVGLVMLFLILATSSPLQTASPEYQLVRLEFKHRSQLQKWVNSGLDVWHVEDQTALVAVSANQLLALESKGLAPQFVPRPAVASFPACYRTYDEMLDLVNVWKSQYPDLFHWHDVGDTWEKKQGQADHDLYVARLTSLRGPDDKPKLFIVAEHHARELITPETALYFIDDLLRNYGDDATITWLLDSREIWVMPMANPDGYTKAAQAENWRKNTHETDTCLRGAPPNSYGVDLNRNYGHEWGNDDGSSNDPCNLTYRGDAPFSEPETRALRDLIQAENFDLLISLHSWGDEVLFPWAYTWRPAPDAERLNALATRMVALNGYTAKQASGTGYLASGDTADWSYGELGIPSFTFEIGGMEDGFFWPPCDIKEQLYQEVRPALIYAALAADRPYQVAGGPEAHQLQLNVADSISIRAQVSDVWTGRDMIESAELFLGALADPGDGIALMPGDGECNYPSEWMAAELESSDYARFLGRRIPIFVVAKDSTGQRGVPAVAWLDLRDRGILNSQSIQLWMPGSDDPRFEIKGSYVYRGADVLMTLSDGRVYRGRGTTGALLYTVDGNRLRAGQNGPVLYSTRDDSIYEGTPEDGVLLYRVERDQVLYAVSLEDEVVLSANVDLAIDDMKLVRLLVATLIDGRY